MNIREGNRKKHKQIHRHNNYFGTSRRSSPDYFDFSEKSFINFLNENINTPKSEFFIPNVVDELIQAGEAKVKVLDTTSKWFGVTYAEDRPEVVAKIAALIEAGEYPAKLFV